MNKTLNQVLITFTAVWVIPILGYLNIGLIPAIIFLVGFLGGFIMWLIFPMNASWKSVRIPYLLTLFLFVIHRIDEQVSGFFVELTKITGVEYPDTVTVEGVLITVFSLLWFLSPLLIRKRIAFGYYGAWSLFMAMGVSELAHFIFPFFTDEPYGYFPGMITVIPLAPVAWWGMYRLIKANNTKFDE